jgi:hypothetical protein
MGLIKEPRDVDFSMKSEPWTEQELKEFSEIIRKSKAAYQAREKRRARPKKEKPATDMV